MKTKAILLGAMLISSSSLYAGKISFKKAAKQFKKSEKISADILQKNILQKMFSCEQIYPDGSYNEIYIRFEKPADKLLDVMNMHEYNLGLNGLIGTRDTINGPVKLKVRTKGNKLAIFHDSKFTPSYVICSPQTDNIVRVENLTDFEILSLATDGENSWAFVKQKESGEIEIELKQIDRRRKLDAMFFKDALGFAKEYQLGGMSQVDFVAGHFYLRVELVDGSSTRLNYILKLDRSGELLSSFELGNFYGSVSVAPNGEVGVIKTDYSAGTSKRLVQSFNADGEVINEFVTDFGVRGIKLDSGYVFKGYCMHNTVGRESCPEERHNYYGVILADNKGCVSS